MFIPSMYKTAPQITGAITGSSIAITAVDPNYTRLTMLGAYDTDASGSFYHAGFCAVTLTSGILISKVGTAIPRILVEEYIPGFLRQAVIYSSVPIAAAALTGSTVSLGTFGPKAYISPCGLYTDVGTSVAEGDTSMGQVFATLSFNNATGIVTATRGVSSLTGFALDTYFCIVDPR